MAKLLNIITNPNEILRQVSKEIDLGELKDEKMMVLYDDMARTMIEKDGVGLAAPQIGRNIRLIAVSTKDEILIMFNPKIIKKSIFKEWGIEGCLSVPNTYGSVKRLKKITYCYVDIKGKKQIKKAEGLLARVIQHEIDHLDGVLFIDKAKNIEEVLEKNKE